MQLALAQPALAPSSARRDVLGQLALIRAPLQVAPRQLFNGSVQ